MSLRTRSHSPDSSGVFERLPVVRRLIGKGISAEESSKLLEKSCVAAGGRGNEEVLRLFLDMEREVEKEKVK